jgi:hypothetical protein
MQNLRKGSNNLEIVAYIEPSLSIELVAEFSLLILPIPLALLAKQKKTILASMCRKLSLPNRIK